MKSKLSFLALIILLSFCIFPSFSQQKCFRVGIMADMNMFTNLFTQNGGWSASVPSDTDGYPLAIPSGTTFRNYHLAGQCLCYQVGRGREYKCYKLDSNRKYDKV